jgi:hypothetical protein
MRTSVNSIEFFTRKDYENLKYKHLDLKDYKVFIKEIHKETAEKHILEDKNGFVLPVNNLGRIRIIKKYRPKGVYAAHKGDKKEYNLHTMGYVYNCTLFKPKARLYYSKQFTSKPPEPLELTEFLDKISTEIYNFKVHRMNIKRPLAKILKNNIRDYDEIKDTDKDFYRR